jgi:chemotaxis protein histidine kinase CheA
LSDSSENKYFSAATIMGDGSIALLLDTNALVYAFDSKILVN